MFEEKALFFGRGSADGKIARQRLDCLIDGPDADHAHQVHDIASLLFSPDRIIDADGLEAVVRQLNFAPRPRISSTKPGKLVAMKA